jgi:diguanylate cyclase
LAARSWSWSTAPCCRGVFVNSFEFTQRIITQLEAERTVWQDPLTNPPNRFAFNEILNGALGRSARAGEEFAILLKKSIFD